MRNLRWTASLSVLVAVVALAGYSDTDLGRTVVRFETTLGDFEVQLFDDVTPLTVQNFLGYVDDGPYESSIVHRSVPDFVIQGGGFTTGPIETFPETFPGKVPIHRPVRNEAGGSNVRGTIAMALEIYDLSAYNDALDTMPLTAAPQPELRLRDLVVILRISVVS